MVTLPIIRRKINYVHTYLLLPLTPPTSEVVRITLTFCQPIYDNNADKIFPPSSGYAGSKLKQKSAICMAIAAAQMLIRKS